MDSVENQNTNNPVVANPKKSQDWTLKEFVLFLFLTLVIVVPVRIFVAQPFVVSGESMDPTFHNGEYLIVDQVTYKVQDPKRGDVIVFKYPQDPSKYFIKRIVGLPGEELNLVGTDVYITPTDESEPFKLVEPYIEFDRETFADTKLGDDEYFVMGDNRLRSLDSRIWGPLKGSYILGRVYLRLLPIENISVLPGQFLQIQEQN